jgi:hypothetical protein
MANETRERVGLAHGAMRLPGVDVLSYNVELKDDGSFVGDRANKARFAGSSRNGESRCATSARIRSGRFPRGSW